MSNDSKRYVEKGFCTPAILSTFLLGFDPHFSRLFLAIEQEVFLDCVFKGSLRLRNRCADKTWGEAPRSESSNYLGCPISSWRAPIHVQNR
jgi:hypothetical protein